MDLGVKTALLLALSEGPGFGLELMARVSAATRGAMRLNRGGTYVALRNLEREGLVRGWMRSTGASGRPRRYYELTPPGIAEVERARQVLNGLLRMPTSSSARVAAVERRRMAERVQRSSELSALALRMRAAALRAGIR